MNRSTVATISRGIPTVTLWLTLTAVCLVLGRVGETIGLPAPQLLIATAIGATTAALSRTERVAPTRRARASHALIGVLMGSYLHPAPMGEAAVVALTSLLTTIATIAICVLVALLLARVSTVSTLDAVLGLAPGGSVAIIASATDLGADAWRVAFAQYLRIALVAVTAPLLVIAVSGRAQQPPDDASTALTWQDATQLVERPGGAAPLLVLVAVCVLGSQLGAKLRLPAPALLGSAILTVVVTLSGTATGFAPSGLLRDMVLVMIGLEVGLHFSRTRLRRTISVLPHLLIAIVTVCVACAGVAWVFDVVTGVGFGDAYLATTPGGINAVLATAASAGTDMTVVSTAQCVRLVVVAMIVPLVTRGAKNWRGRKSLRHNGPAAEVEGRAVAEGGAQASRRRERASSVS